MIKVENIKVLKEIMLFTYQHLGNYIENNKEETDWNKIKKSTFIEYAPIIDKFYKELNININLNLQKQLHLIQKKGSVWVIY